MKKLALFGLMALLPCVASSQVTPKPDEVIVGAVNWDMDGEAADDDQVVTAVAMEDSKSDYTITAQPDTCRLLDITVVDTNLTAGTLTVTGTGCLGEARSCSFAFTAGDDTGVQTLTCTDGEGAYFANVSGVATGVMTGESDETFTLGYTSNSVYGQALYGKAKSPGPNNENGVDPYDSYESQRKITTSAVASTTVTGVVGAEDAFAPVSVGDLLIITVSGTVYQRKVTAKASADSITVNSALTIPAAGVTYRFKKFYFSTNPADDLAFATKDADVFTFGYNVAANADTGGVLLTFECANFSPTYPTATWYTPVYTATLPVTVASGATGSATYSLDLRLTPYDRCRVKWKFGTGDDGDGTPEDISYTVVIRRR